MVTVNIQRKDLYLIGAVFIFLIGAGIVIATGGTPQQLNGHSLDEVGLPVSCSDGQVMKWVNADSKWECRDDNAGSPSGGIMCVSYCHMNPSIGYAEWVMLFKSPDATGRNGHFAPGTPEYSSTAWGHDCSGFGGGKYIYCSNY